MIFVAIGIYQIAAKQKWESGLIFMTVGIVLTVAKVQHLRFFEIIHDFWPAALIIVGIGMLIRHLATSSSTQNSQNNV